MIGNCKLKNNLSSEEFVLLGSPPPAAVLLLSNGHPPLLLNCYCSIVCNTAKLPLSELSSFIT